MNFLHKSQVFFFVLVAFILGVASASFLTVSNSVILWILLSGIFILTISSYQKTFGQTSPGIIKRKWAILFSILILSFVGGLARYNYFIEANRILNNFSDLKVGSQNLDFQFVGYVNSQSEVSGSGQRFILKVKRVDVPGRSVLTSENVLIVSDLLPKYKFGEKLLLKGSLKLPENFDDFDYVSYLKKDGIEFISYFPEISQDNQTFNINFFEETKIFIYEHLFFIKDKFELAINKSIAEPSASFINGILFGTRQSMPEDLKIAFQRTSTTHILAISGYNIAIISEVILLALIYFFKRRTSFWISVISIIIFTIMVGASASVVRASVMGLILLFANSYGRLYDPKNSIILAGAIMILANPMNLVFDIGFQLSFLAVIGLLYLYPLIDRKIKAGENIKSLKEIFLMTLSAQIMVMPLIIYYFENLSLIGIVANIFILPFVPFSMLAGFLSGFLGIFSSLLGQLVGYIAWAITSYQIYMVNFFAGFRYSAITITMEPITILAMYLIIFYFIFRGHFVRKQKVISD